MFPTFCDFLAQLPPPEPALRAINYAPLPAARLVIFGATGDLVSKRAVRDALAYLAEHEILDGRRQIVTLMAPRSLPGSTYMESFRQGDADSRPLSEAATKAMARLCRLDRPGSQVTGLDVGSLQDYRQLVNDLGAENAVFYGALPPKLYGPWLQNLRLSGLARAPKAGFRRILLEKPFGQNSSQARQLAESLEADFQPGQVLLVDHFLAYPGWRHMVNFRSDPQVDEALSNRYVENFEVRILESIKSNDRPYFRETGLINDMLQNHALQVYTAMAMDLPLDRTPESLSQARREAVEAIQVEESTVCWGQYAGFNDPKQGSPPGDRDSQAETLVSFNFHVQLPRWQGVQFRIINAKGVDHKRSGVNIRLRSLPEGLARRWKVSPASPAVIRTTMNPSDEIWVEFPLQGTRIQVEPDPTVLPLPPYATILPQSLWGNSAIFASPQESLAGWGLADKIRLCLRSRPFLFYRVGDPVEQILPPDKRWPTTLPPRVGRQLLNGYSLHHTGGANVETQAP